MYRRNDFKSWFADVGFIYVIVGLLISCSMLIAALINLIWPSY